MYLFPCLVYFDVRRVFRHWEPAAALRNSVLRQLSNFAVGSAFVVLLAPGAAYAGLSCPVPAAQAVSYSRSVLANPQEIFLTDRERAAILCLLEAVARLETSLTAPETLSASEPPVLPASPRRELMTAPAQPALSDPD